MGTFARAARGRFFRRILSGVKTLPATLNRPGAFLTAGLASWPLIAYSLVSAAGFDGCIRAHGIVGFFATHGAMMRAVPSCPSEAVGLPGVIDSGMAFLLAAAILVTAAHVLIAIIGSQGAEWVHRIADAISRLIPQVLADRKTPVRVRLPLIGASQDPGQKFGIRVPWRRGPPAWSYAAQ